MRTYKYLKIERQIELDFYKFIEVSKKPREKKRAMAILLVNIQIMMNLFRN